jgi:hypothetical protein
LVKGTPYYKEQEFVTSTDERFRPVNALTGPEGALYLVDMHHGVIQHRISLTSYPPQAGRRSWADHPASPRTYLARGAGRP